MDLAIKLRDAEQALRTFEHTARRSASAARYLQISFHLFVWGGIWLIVNTLALMKTGNGTLIWDLLMAAGVAASLMMALLFSSRERRLENVSRAAATLAAGLLLIYGANAIFHVKRLGDVEAVQCLGIGLAYIVTGALVGWRLTVIGVVMMVGVIVGMTLAPSQVFLLMEVLGGGGLIMGGLWLRVA